MEVEIVENLRSKNSRVPTYLTFVNCTRRRVHLIWINYQGMKEAYKELKPNDIFDINTFETHPWICQDIESGERLLLNHHEVYLPQNQQTEKVRHLVNITIPVFSLEVWCIQTIKQYLKSKNDIVHLRLPVLLKNKLTSLF